MLSTPIEKIPIIPEEYDSQHYEKINYSLISSEMIEIERRFVNGLIRYYNPKNIIEIGVSRGGGTVNILNAISDRANCNLVSIDRLDHFYADASIPVGFDADSVFPNANNWELFAGYEPSAVLDKLSYKYDFAVIDTSHNHPMETLNFLCVLPYLNDGAIVVLHDVSFHLLTPNTESYATRVLMSSVVAHKLTHRRCSNCEQNIVAFQVTNDTRKYIENVFDSLFIPWTQVNEKDDVKSIRGLLTKHYNARHIEKFDCAFAFAYVFIASGGITFDESHFKEISINAFDKKRNVIFYGAGIYMRSLLTAFYELSIPFDFTIWDKNADAVKEVCGHAVSEPNFDNKIDGVSDIVITIFTKKVKNELAEQFRALGYTVYSSIEDFLRNIYSS